MTPGTLSDAGITTVNTIDRRAVLESIPAALASLKESARTSQGRSERGSVMLAPRVPELAGPNIHPLERRGQPRGPISCELWMIGHEGSTVLRCRCDNASPTGMHLVVPLGYGIAEGQRYELRSHLPGARPLPGFDYARSRWAKVVRTEIVFGDGGDHLGVGVSLDPLPDA